MVETYKLDVKLIMCPIVREPDGLAMSSRNIHLSIEDRKNALALNRCLLNIKLHFQNKTINELEAMAINDLSSVSGLSLEYFSIRNSATLQHKATKTALGLVALVAAKVGNTRLIDNIILS
jgi:pantoate--beta-alanine ligase